MSKTYTVPVKNRFSQLDSDVETEAPVITKKAGGAASSSGIPSPSSAQQGPPVVRKGGRRSETAPAATTSEAARSPGERREGRGGRQGRGAGYRPPRAHAPVEEEVAPGTVTEAVPLQWQGGRRGLNDRAGDRYRIPPPFRGREYDRRSGTGRGREMKRSGRGGHNWGLPGSEEVPAPIEGGPAAAAVPVAPAEEGESPVADVGGILSGGEEPAALQKIKAEEEPFVDFSEWQKTQKQKRAQLLQETLTAPARTVDATDLEKDGYHRYEREETEQERVAREMRLPHHEVEESGEDEGMTRPKTYNLYEFTGDFGYRRGGRGGGGVGRGGGRGTFAARVTAAGAERTGFVRPMAIQQPVNLDLTDSSAFPSLS